MLYHRSPTAAFEGTVLVVVVLTPPPVTVPPTVKLPPIPAPPDTCNAPEFVPVLAVTFDITNVVVVPVPLAAVLPLTNGVPFKVTDPVELTVNVQVPDTRDVALTACATSVEVLNVVPELVLVA